VEFGKAVEAEAAHHLCSPETLTFQALHNRLFSCLSGRLEEQAKNLVLEKQVISDVEGRVRILQQPDRFEYWTVSALDLSTRASSDTWLLLLNDEWRNESIRGIDEAVKDSPSR
jgi:hypothetical protein